MKKCKNYNYKTEYKGYKHWQCKHCNGADKNVEVWGRRGLGGNLSTWISSLSMERNQEISSNMVSQ